MGHEVGRVLAVALLAALALQPALPHLTATPASRWGLGVRAVLALRLGLASAVPGLLVAIVLGPGLATWPAVAASLAGALLGFAALWLRYRPLRRVVAQAVVLGEPERREAAWRELAAYLRRARPAPHGSPRALGAWMSAVQRAAGHLFDLGDFERCAEALELLEGLAGGPVIDAIQAALHAAVRAHQPGRLRAAGEALRSVPRPTAAPMTESWMQATEALVQALDGRPEEALRALAGFYYPESWHARTRLEARAHALCARSDEDGAREALYALERRFGKTGLECVVTAEGPASALARALFARGAGYRSPAR